jgi:hypothetical protein
MNRACRSPPSALPGISPSRGEIGKPHASYSIRNGKDGREPTTSRSPSLWRRWPAGQRGVNPTLRSNDTHPKHPHQKYFPTKSIPYPKPRKKHPKSLRNFLNGARIARTLLAFRPRIHRKALRRGGTGAGVGRVTQTFQPRGRAAISPVGREKGGGGFGPAVAAFPMS